MSHLDEGTILTARDLGLVHSGVTEHLDACGSCRAMLDEVRMRRDGIERALDSLDAPVDVQAAKAAVRARLDAGPWKAQGQATWGGSLRRAAALMLLAAGTAYALPGSPVRSWITSESPEADIAIPSGITTSASAAPAAISADVPPGGILVAITGASEGAAVEVVWVEGGQARIYAPTGSRFRYAEGRLQATPAGGPIRVELPRGFSATVEVDGAPFLRVTSGAVAALVEPETRTDERIVFRVPLR